MTWTIKNPPTPAVNSSPELIKTCVDAANAALKNGASESSAVLAGVAAMRSQREASHEFGKSKGLEVINNSSGSLELHFYGEIGPNFWGDGISATDIATTLKGVPREKDIVMRMNSPGGDVFDGIAIYNLLRQRKGKVTCYIDSLCASIATVISLAADTVYMAEEGFYMVHSPFAMAMGTAGDLRDVADRLDSAEGQILSVYSRHTGLEEKELKFMMEEETWMTPQEAQGLGFVDEIIDTDVKMAAMFTEASKKWFAKAPTGVKLSSAKRRLKEQEQLLQRLSK